MGQPERVQVYDFPRLAEGKATPYGLDDLSRNAGGLTVGSDHDTAQFAVASIRRWGTDRGRTPYPGATTLTIVADGGGSNGYRMRLWKAEHSAGRRTGTSRSRSVTSPRAPARETRSSTGCSVC